jgi:hypothetical protein
LQKARSPRLIPAHAKLAHTGPDVLDVVVEVRADVAMKRIPVHVPHSLRFRTMMMLALPWNRSSEFRLGDFSFGSECITSLLEVPHNRFHKGTANSYPAATRALN